MIVLDDDDFANLPLSSSRSVEVLSFVPAAQIDAVQMGKPYYCDPTGGDIKPYVLLRDSLEKADRVAVVKVALRQRERLAMLRPREGVLVLQTLLWPDEVRAPDFGFDDKDVTVRPQELAMAESYISALSGDFEPGEFSDNYREALEEVIEAKAAGARDPGTGGGARSTGQVVDLMDALRRSVAEAKERRGDGAAQPAGTKAAAKAPAKQAAKKTAKKATKAAAKKTTKKAGTTKKAVAKNHPTLGLTRLDTERAAMSASDDFGDLRALFLNCTLKRSPEVSNTAGLAANSIAIMRAHGVHVDEVRAVDHELAPGVQPDMRQHGFARDDWPAIYETVRAADILVVATPISAGRARAASAPG